MRLEESVEEHPLVVRAECPGVGPDKDVCATIPGRVLAALAVWIVTKPGGRLLPWFSLKDLPALRDAKRRRA